jgi:hypothetical protein
MRTFKTRANGTLVVGARIGPAEPHRPLVVRKKRGFSGFFVSKLREKLLDDTKPTLYCDHQFDRQFALSLS